MNKIPLEKLIHILIHYKDGPRPMSLWHESVPTYFDPKKTDTTSYIVNVDIMEEAGKRLIEVAKMIEATK